MLHWRRDKTAFAISGGGARGAAQVGMLRALIERDITPDFIVGVSIGAWNGAWLAHRPDLEWVKSLAGGWPPSSPPLAGHGRVAGRPEHDAAQAVALRGRRALPLHRPAPAGVEFRGPRGGAPHGRDRPDDRHESGLLLRAAGTRGTGLVRDPRRLPAGHDRRTAARGWRPGRSPRTGYRDRP